MMRREVLTGWGRYPSKPCLVTAPRTESEVSTLARHGGVIARGNGRAYGDSALGGAATLDMRRMNRILSFDPATGVLVAEAGLLLADIITTFLPRGWFPYVTPGTKFVSLGGAIASDVHGKNHHCDGAFGSFVEWVDLVGADGKMRRLSRSDNDPLFEWTLGGMGLTGVILRAAIRLRPVESGWIRQRTIVAPNLRAAMAGFEEAQDATYSVAWIDCLATGCALGRSLIMLGEHARVEEVPDAFRASPLSTPTKKKRTVPFDAPALALNRYSVKAFNALYWRKGQGGPEEVLIDWDSYFYPLDAILGWNRIYGRRGFVQFQCALPLDRAEAGLIALLTATARAGQGSFLAVLKRFGAQDSRFSFPMEGFTLALDFPANPKTFALLDQLDRITLAHGGRFYLAKDARLSASTFHEADPRAAQYRDLRRGAGLDHAFASAQSQRLLL
ncbi:FAD-binding oxidoreductase [Alloyangia pacifica]|uniref:FAD/FMN-containing dehydrogenase n=1 Tax=Alloyangia pacifica TaxID=311180 RepID=A0A1I6WEF0_9RHOB|nr:FAD-binding oxidoreductase [Alloyangia pacifica]SDI62677.1 FAD/FMN-containing dehydrogenase [Alloyangia pacifica]SFT24363.1 FAD/FMN-containing dehydrogenase [Alloyangia pacifica]